MRIFEVSTAFSDRIEQIAKQSGLQITDVKNKSELQKMEVRIKNNNVLASIVADLIPDTKRQKVKSILNNLDIPDYEIAVVVGNRYSNYHNDGFVLGENGHDIKDHASITDAVNFLLDSEIGV